MNTQTFTFLSTFPENYWWEDWHSSASLGPVKKTSLLWMQFFFIPKKIKEVWSRKCTRWKVLIKLLLRSISIIIKNFPFSRFSFLSQLLSWMLCLECFWAKVCIAASTGLSKSFTGFNLWEKLCNKNSRKYAFKLKVGFTN